MVQFKKIKITFLVLILATLLIFSGCSNSSTKNQKEIIAQPNFDVNQVKEVEKLVFAIPNMDKNMCETYPKLITEALEDENGVLDVEFIYDGHILTVYYDPKTITKDDLLNYETYNWIGTEFLSEESMDMSQINPKQMYDNRFENNKFEMPEDHMQGNENGYPMGYAQKQMGMN